MSADNTANNTDVEIYRKVKGDYYSPSISVSSINTQKIEKLVINVGGTCKCLTIEQLWEAVNSHDSLVEDRTELQEIITTISARSVKDTARIDSLVKKLKEYEYLDGKIIKARDELTTLHSQVCPKCHLEELEYNEDDGLFHCKAVVGFLFENEDAEQRTEQICGWSGKTDMKDYFYTISIPDFNRLVAENQTFARDLNNHKNIIVDRESEIGSLKVKIAALEKVEQETEYDVILTRLEADGDLVWCAWTKDLDDYVFYGTGDTKAKALRSFEETVIEMKAVYKDENRNVPEPERYRILPPRQMDNNN